jgi:DNA-binding MarR family transcriptional regulator
VGRDRKLSGLIELFQGIVARYSTMEDAAVRLVNVKHPLFKSELHMIKCIKEHPEANVTRLAEILGITKGAVSQVIRRLEAKGMIARVGRNRKEYVLSLTSGGLDAYRAHEEFHRGHFRELAKAMAELTPAEIAFIKKVFREITGFYGVFQKRVSDRIRALEDGREARRRTASNADETGGNHVRRHHRNRPPDPLHRGS